MFSHAGRTRNPEEADMASPSDIKAVRDCLKIACVYQVVCLPNHHEALLVTGPGRRCH
jgi:hypothetical protein